MAAITVSTTANGGGLSVSFTQAVTPTINETLNATKAAAKTGTLTRSDANTGTLTMDAGHGFVTGNRLDVFWTDANGVQRCQHKATAGTVSGNSVPIDLGVGDDLPTGTNVAVTAQVATPLDFPLTTAQLIALAVGGTQAGKVVLEKADGTVVYNVTLGANGVGAAWVSGYGASNPVSDTVAKAYVTNASSSAANQISVIAGLAGS